MRRNGPKRARRAWGWGAGPAWIFTSLWLAGCASEPAADPVTEEALPVSVGFAPVADVKTLMLSVLEPAAEVYWDAVGEILDFDGVHEIRPRTSEEWEAVLGAALVVAESGNLLMMEGRAKDREQWIGFALGLVETGRQAVRAAEARDPQAVFDAGAEVYYACSNCHATYATETLRPNDTRSVADDRIEPDDSGG